MKERFHGIDFHKNYSTIQVLDRAGKPIELINKCKDLDKYIFSLDDKDAVAIEMSTGVFKVAGQIREQGAQCEIVNPYRFKIITDSWKKTDKVDAMALAEGIWVHVTSERRSLPTVYTPQPTVLELRKLFSLYDLLTQTITQYKNNIRAAFRDARVELNEKQSAKLFKFTIDEVLTFLQSKGVSAAIITVVTTSLQLLAAATAQKEQLTDKIYETSRPLQEQVELLMSIKGVSAFLAIAYLSEVDDPKRFKKVKQLYAYLGVVPTTNSSGGKTKHGHCVKASRKLCRTLFTQSIHHIVASNPKYESDYEELKRRRGAGRARMAFMRKIFGVMRRMLINNEPFRWVNERLYNNKLREYRRKLKKMEELKKTA